MGLMKDLWEKFKKNWILNGFAVVGFFAILAEVWPILYLVNPWLAVAVVLFYNNVITFFGGGLLIVACVVLLYNFAKKDA